MSGHHTGTDIERRPARRQGHPARHWRDAPATLGLIAVMVSVHVAAVAVPTLRAVLFEHGAQTVAAVAAGEWHRLVTSAFLHSHAGSLVLEHIVANMAWLMILGLGLEPRIGSMPLVTTYVSTAIGGSTVAHLVGHGGVGASGAVFGLLGVAMVDAVRLHRSELRGWLVLMGLMLTAPLWMGAAGARIGWAAHCGGFAAGLLIAAGWAIVARADDSTWVRVVVAAAVGALFLALARHGPVWMLP